MSPEPAILPITLTEEELIQLTKRKRYGAQIRVLEKLCIPVKARPDGSPCVLREAANQSMGASSPRQQGATVKLRLDAL